jgi:hypothetical protein
MSRTSTAAPHCEIHPHVKMVCPACMGASAAGVTSKAKAKASARNGKLGGRPKLEKHSRTCIFKVTGRYTPKCPRCLYEAGKIETYNRHEFPIQDPERRITTRD